MGLFFNLLSMLFAVAVGYGIHSCFLYIPLYVVHKEAVAFTFYYLFLGSLFVFMLKGGNIEPVEEKKEDEEDGA